MSDPDLTLPANLDRRKQAPLHEKYADLLPPLSSAEFEALQASIAQEGVRDPILIDEENVILDGHHRYRVEPEAPRKVIPGLSDAEKRAFVLATNFHRRNLSPEQKADLRQRQIEIARLLKEENKSQEKIAVLLGVDQRTVGRWLEDGHNRHVPKMSDNRVKVSKEDQGAIFDRTAIGEALSQVAADYGISERHARRICKSETKRREREKELSEQAEAIASGKVSAAKGPFDVIVIDPPWPYGTKYDPDGRRVANPYPEMSLEDLAGLDLEASENCVLWLWTTHKFMRHSFPLLDAWGFEDKAILTWDKEKMGTGHWVRSQTEFCILAIRGKVPWNLTNETTLLREKSRQHSRKPDCFYEMVEKLCQGKKVDWFSREKREGWAQRGNDPEKFGEVA